MINPEDEIRYDFRASCNEEEAIAKLLGWMRGIKRIPNLKISEDGFIDITQLPHILTLPCPLDVFLYDERELSSIQFHNAAAQSDFEAAKKWEQQVSYWDGIAGQVVRYKLAIQQELARPNSKLKLDPVLSEETGIRHITLASLDTWARVSFGFGVLDEEDVAELATIRKDLKQPRMKGLQKEAAILERLRELGYDPKFIPPNRPGKAGVKAQVLKSFDIPGVPFVSVKAFDTTWQSLRKSGELVDLKYPPK